MRLGNVARATKEELNHYLSQYHVQGTKIKFNVLRNGKPIYIELVAREQRTCLSGSGGSSGTQALRW